MRFLIKKGMLSFLNFYPREGVSKMVAITTTNVEKWRGIMRRITALSVFLQEGHCMEGKESSNKVCEMFKYEMSRLRKVKVGFDSLPVVEKIRAIFTEAGIKLEKLAKFYSEVISKNTSEELKKVFKILEVA